ncbi:hypothetical protein [Polaromonas hydrogenivorans]|uniref:Uncharacterized protein n=1 Tax=Polaromonas hydrogenivorans TaxID=335476 RepID=A0AAU7M085_9BURK
MLNFTFDLNPKRQQIVDASGCSSGFIFEYLGRLMVDRATRPDVNTILMYFALSATSLASAVNGLLKLLDEISPPKPLVGRLLSSGAADRDMIFGRAQAELESRGFSLLSQSLRVMSPLLKVVMGVPIHLSDLR